jgi:tRNA-Thr(GGU) m(6)t(6)A37 methyltransferase TsaA
MSSGENVSIISDGEWKHKVFCGKAERAERAGETELALGDKGCYFSSKTYERNFAMTEKELSFTVKSLGYIISPYAERGEAPPQSTRSEALPGKIVIFPEYAPALLGLENYSHVMVFFCFHLMDEEPELVHRPRGGGDLRGLFASRTPRRPNRIGLSVLPLERIEENVLHVSQVDMLDGTPVLDLKAYEPGLLPPLEAVRTPKRERI